MATDDKAIAGEDTNQKFLIEMENGWADWKNQQYRKNASPIRRTKSTVMHLWVCRKLHAL